MFHETGIRFLDDLGKERVDEGGERWRIGSARPLVTVYLLCISVCITLCIRRLLVKRIDEPANQISLRTSSQLGISRTSFSHLMTVVREIPSSRAISLWLASGCSAA